MKVKSKSEVAQSYHTIPTHLKMYRIYIKGLKFVEKHCGVGMHTHKHKKDRKKINEMG